MKNVWKLFGVLLVGGLILTSCTKADVKAQKILESEITDGSWRISLFNDSGIDETSDFSGYTFNFEDNGSLVASSATGTLNGTWQVTDSNSNDDSPDDLHFYINFNVTNDFQDLNDDWDIVSNSSTVLELSDVSGGNGTTDLLTFEKI